MLCSSVPFLVTSAGPHGRIRHYVTPFAFDFAIKLVPSEIGSRIRCASATRRALEESDFTRYSKLQTCMLDLPWSITSWVWVHLEGVIPPYLAFDNKFDGDYLSTACNMVMGLFDSDGMSHENQLERYPLSCNLITSNTEVRARIPA